MSKLRIVVATNRTQFWEQFVTYMSQNSVEHEILFVGPAMEHPSVPAHVSFVDVPPHASGAARCWEIGARMAKHELLGLMPDDVLFTSGFLDAVVEEAAKPHHCYDTFTARYMHNGKDSLADQRMWGDPALPLLPLCGFSYADAHYKIGGIDKRFNAVFWDSDLYMHMNQLGGGVTLLYEYMCYEHRIEHDLCNQHAAHDGKVLAELWPGPFGPEMKRTSERQRWEDL